MSDEPGDGSGPSLAVLILKGALMIFFAFIAANTILILHMPVGH